MKQNTLWRILVLIAVFVLLVAACSEGDDATEEDFTFGLFMVGPKEDRGWNQAHWEAVNREDV